MVFSNLNVVSEKRRFDATLNQRALTFAARRVGHLHQPLLEPGARLLLKLLRERNRETDSRAGHV